MNKKVIFIVLVIIFILQFALYCNIAGEKTIANKHLSDVIEEVSNGEVSKIVIKNRYGNYNITINDALKKDLLMLNLNSLEICSNSNKCNSNTSKYNYILIYYDDIKGNIIKLDNLGQVSIETSLPTDVSNFPVVAQLTQSSQKQLNDIIASVVMHYPDFNEQLEKPDYLLSDCSVEINNELTFFEKPLININGSTYVSIREFCEKTNLDIEWVQGNNGLFPNTIKVESGDN